MIVVPVFEQAAFSGTRPPNEQARVTYVSDESTDLLYLGEMIHVQFHSPSSNEPLGLRFEHCFAFMNHSLTEGQLLHVNNALDT